jgi:hypothetical protein
MPHAKTPISDRSGALTRRLALLAHWGLEDDISPPPTAETDDAEDFLALPAAQDLRFTLAPHADVLAHRCATPAGAAGLPLRLLRGFFRLVIGPWLDKQTLFNKAVLSSLQHEQQSSRGYLEQLVAHVRNQRTFVDDFARRLDHDLTEFGQVQRLGFRYVVEAVEQSVARPSGTATNGHTAATQALEQVFLQTWLPRPPARLLAIGDDDTDVLELADLGYQVVADNRLPAPNESDAAHPSGAFDAVVWLARSGAGRDVLSAFQCALRSGGRAVVRLALADAVHQPLPADFRLLEAAYAVADGHDWTYTSDATVVESLRARGASAGIALIAAEKQ